MKVVVCNLHLFFSTAREIRYGNDFLVLTFLVDFKLLIIVASHHHHNFDYFHRLFYFKFLIKCYGTTDAIIGFGGGSVFLFILLYVDSALFFGLFVFKFSYVYKVRVLVFIKKGNESLILGI